MRRVVLFCLGVVSCASPDVPRVDGVPEDPGNRPPTLPVDMTPEAPVLPPNASGPTSGVTDDADPSETDAGAAAGVTPPPPAPTPPSTTPPAPSEPASSAGDETLAGSTDPGIDSAEATEPSDVTESPGIGDAGAVEPCETGDAGLDAGATLDAGDSSTAQGGCHVR